MALCFLCCAGGFLLTREGRVRGQMAAPVDKTSISLMRSLEPICYQLRILIIAIAITIVITITIIVVAIIVVVINELTISDRQTRS